MHKILASFVVLLALAVPASAQNIFNNGFESQGTCAWSATIPVSTNCTTVTFVGQTAVGSVDGDPSLADYLITFDVTRNGGGDIFIEKVWARSGSPNPQQGLWFVLESSASTYGGGTTPIVSLSASGSPPTGDTATHYRVGSGATRRFSLFVRLNNHGGTSGSYRLRLVALTYDTDGFDDDGDIVISLDTQFRTALVTVGN